MAINNLSNLSILSISLPAAFAACHAKVWFLLLEVITSTFYKKIGQS
jgi:hypothetical protein